MIDCINWFFNTEPALHRGIITIGSLMYNPFVDWWILLAIILYHLCLVWALRKHRLQMNIGVFTPLVFSAQDCIELMLTLKNTLQISLLQPGPSNFFYENFYIINSISLIAVSLFKWSISYWVSYGSLYFFRNWLISSKLSNLCV